MQHDRATSPNSGGQNAESAAWNAAYLRFETPAEEIAKFERRLRRLGEAAWPRNARIVDLFCGRGGGMQALTRLGFHHLVGVDLSLTLLSHYTGSGAVTAADCRAIPLEAGSADIAIVQGGLHHLPVLPTDLERTLDEVARILVPGGTFVVVEPWRTPFLDVVHWFGDRRLARRAWPRLDALATMIEHERATYTAWLSQPAAILDALVRRFPDHSARTAMGKLEFVGRRP